MVKIEGDGFVLREWQEADVEGLSVVGNNKKIAQNMVDTFPFPYTIEDAKKWIEIARGKEKINSNFVVLVDGKVAGGVGFDVKDGSEKGVAGGGYWLGEDFWGNGIATKAWKLVRDYAFKNFDIHKLEASVYSWNPASARVQEKCGFTKEGCLRQSFSRFDRLGDEWKFGLLREEWEKL